MAKVATHVVIALGDELIAAVHSGEIHARQMLDLLLRQLAEEQLAQHAIVRRTPGIHLDELGHQLIALFLLLHLHRVSVGHDRPFLPKRPLVFGRSRPLPPRANGQAVRKSRVSIFVSRIADTARCHARCARGSHSPEEGREMGRGEYEPRIHREAAGEGHPLPQPYAYSTFRNRFAIGTVISHMMQR